MHFTGGARVVSDCALVTRSRRQLTSSTASDLLFQVQVQDFITPGPITLGATTSFPYVALLEIHTVTKALHPMEIERDESLCKYNGGSCPNKRAIRNLTHGLLRLCEYHQSRANEYQKTYLMRQKNRRRPPPAIETESVTSPAPPAAAAAAVPIVFFVVAPETNIAASLVQLAKAGQQLSAVTCQSNDQLMDLLRHAGCSEAISAAGGSQSALAMVMTSTPAHRQSETTLTDTDEPNSSLALPSIDTESPSLLDDGEWFRDLLEVQDQS